MPLHIPLEEAAPPCSEETTLPGQGYSCWVLGTSLFLVGQNQQTHLT